MPNSKNIANMAHFTS